jgi:hypothetical protein
VITDKNGKGGINPKFFILLDKGHYPNNAPFEFESTDLLVVTNLEGDASHWSAIS